MNSLRLPSLMFSLIAFLIPGWLAMLPPEAAAQGGYQLVTMCFRNRTIQVPFYLTMRYAAQGATYGACSSELGFVKQPQSQTRYVGGNVTFTSVASGSAPTFQWRRNGSNILGATDANYSIMNVQTSHAGNYTVVASNASGSLTSAVAILTVLTSPTALLVTTTNDSGSGSLRQIMANAESVTNAVVAFAANVRGTITLTNGEIPISKSLTIAGPGADVLAVSGNFLNRVLKVLSGTVKITGLTICDGLEHGGIGFPEQNGIMARGGGIMNQSILTLASCTLSNNAVVAGRGGDSLENGTFSFAGNGGNGSGGGVCNIDTLAMIDCVLVGNFATGGEGGNDSGGNNGTGGQGYGGGFYSLGNATLTRCAFLRNGARAGEGNGGVGGASGGGVYNDLNLSLTNCTVADNSAEGSLFDFGGGIFDNGTSLIIRSCTLTGNAADFGGGMSTGGADLGNTIVAGNLATTFGPDGSANVTSSDYNLIQDTNGWTLTGSSARNIYGQNPLLAPPQGNNPGYTRALTAASPALDKGKSFGALTDQRGQGRPWNIPTIANAAGGDGSDIGAFELGPDSPVLSVLRSGNAVALWWSTNAAGFRLQSVTTLAPSNNWLNVSGNAATVGNRIYVTNAVGSGSRFYRLIFP